MFINCAYYNEDNSEVRRRGEESREGRGERRELGREGRRVSEGEGSRG